MAAVFKPDDLDRGRQIERFKFGAIAEIVPISLGNQQRKFAVNQRRQPQLFRCAGWMQGIAEHGHAGDRSKIGRGEVCRSGHDRDAAAK